MSKSWKEHAQSVQERDEPASWRRKTNTGSGHEMSRIRKSTQHERLMGSTCRRQHDKHSRCYASAESENELLAIRTREGKRRTARNSARVGASASVGVSQRASSMDKRQRIPSALKIFSLWYVEDRGARQRERDEGQRLRPPREASRRALSPEVVAPR
jgi:hypothetical protein